MTGLCAQPGDSASNAREFGAQFTTARNTLDLAVWGAGQQNCNADPNYFGYRSQAGDTDTILKFKSDQGNNGGAHDEDQLGEVIILSNVIDTVEVNAGVFYGVYEPLSAEG